MRTLPRFTSLALALTLSAAAAACADPEDKAVDNFIAAADSYARSVCRCDYDSAAVGIPAYTSDDACFDDFPANSAEIGCVEGVFRDEPTDYRAALECLATAYRNAAACIDGATCDQDLTRLDCYLAFGEEADDCPDLEADVEEKLRECWRI